ncbi:VOC family protein [Halopiger goleimassiliensis]|uniref:VOC family protein n=1 Tax=Halopiger goleimassiliensis TaxID=1293048 RepID=UPI000677E59F|nr:VOC family protein [Halopiger goleimassiliensis]
METLPDGTRIGRTALRVSDVEAELEFYRDVVGLEVLNRTASRVTLGVDDASRLVLEDDGNESRRGREAAGLYHVAFRMPTRAALGDALGRIRDRWHLEGASDHRVSEALYLTDPDGNGVEIYRDYPREEWPRTDDGRIRMATDPLDLEALEAAATGESSALPGTTIGHVHLEVTSLEAFETFYVETLGFDVQATVPGATFVSAGGYHHHIGANTWNRRTNPADGRGLSWFELVVPEGRAVEALRERLRERERPLREADDGFVVVDPDGIDVRIRPGSP